MNTFLRSADTLTNDELRAVEMRSVTDRGIVPLPGSRIVDPNTASTLIAAARSFAESVTVPGLRDSERLARAAAAGDAARDLRDATELLNVYGPGSSHARLTDVAIAGGVDPNMPAEVRQAAIDRLRTDQQYRALLNIQTRTVATADVAALHQLTQDMDAPSLNPVPAVWLNSKYVGKPDPGPMFYGRHVSNVWSNLPTAFLDPAAGTDVSTQTSTVFAGQDKSWHTSALAISLSMQRIDWSTDQAKETEAAIAASVDITLETQLLSDIAPGSARPTANDFAGAESAVGAKWAQGADLIVCNGADRPKIVRKYLADGMLPGDRPTIMATAGWAAGTALVMASSALVVEVSDREWLAANTAKPLGKDISVIRYGLAALRVAGAVEKVTVS